MKIPRNLFVLRQAAIALVSVTAASICRAAPPPPRSEGAAHQARADAAADAGHLGEAVDAWRKAWEFQSDDATLACNIGRGEFRRGQLREAALWLTRCVHLVPKAATRQTVDFNKQVTVELLTARQKLSALMISVDEPDTRVVIDDTDIRITPLREDVFVHPGEHRIHAYNGLRSASMAISTVAGKEYRVALALKPSAPLAILPPSTPPAWWIRSTLPPAFNWWPVIGGGFLVGTGVVLGTVFIGDSNAASDTATLTLATIQGDGKTCSKTPAENDPRCAAYNQFNSRSASYSTAAIGSFIAAGAITAGIIGYAIYENNRVTVATTISGITGRYQW